MKIGAVRGLLSDPYLVLGARQEPSVVPAREDRFPGLVLGGWCIRESVGRMTRASVSVYTTTFNIAFNRLYG